MINACRFSLSSNSGGVLTSKVFGRNTKIRKYTNKATQKNNTVPTAYSKSAGVLTSELRKHKQPTHPQFTNHFLILFLWIFYITISCLHYICTYNSCSKSITKFFYQAVKRFSSSSSCHRKV